MSDKKQVRAEFRNAVFERDRYRCRCCNAEGKDRQGGENHKKYHKNMNPVDLDSHHIYNRDLMPHGGYVKENGISVCDQCHLEAEEHWRVGGKLKEEFSPEALYKLIGSSLEIAQEASLKLKD